MLVLQEFYVCLLTISLLSAKSEIKSQLLK